MVLASHQGRHHCTVSRRGALRKLVTATHHTSRCPLIDHTCLCTSNSSSNVWQSCCPPTSEGRGYRLSTHLRVATGLPCGDGGQLCLDLQVPRTDPPAGQLCGVPLAGQHLQQHSRLPSAAGSIWLHIRFSSHLVLGSSLMQAQHPRWLRLCSNQNLPNLLNVQQCAVGGAVHHMSLRLAQSLSQTLHVQ